MPGSDLEGEWPERGAEQLAAALARLADEEPLAQEHVDALSALHGESLASYRQTWEALSAPARERSLRALCAAAVDRLRLDFSPLNYLALDDPDEAVRLAGVESALEDESAYLRDRLLRLVAEDPSHRVRRAATEELARFALLAELQGLAPDEGSRIREALLARVEAAGESPGIRSAALAALSYFNDEPMAELLAGAFQDPLLRLGAIRGMGRSADPRWTERLLPVLGSEDPDMRLEAARALAEIEDERAIGPLSELVDDPDADVRLAVLEALGSFGGEEAREALLYALQDREIRIREVAERALGQLEAEENPLDV